MSPVNVRLGPEYGAIATQLAIPKTPCNSSAKARERQGPVFAVGARITGLLWVCVGDVEPRGKSRGDHDNELLSDRGFSLFSIFLSVNLNPVSDLVFAQGLRASLRRRLRRQTDL